MGKYLVTGATGHLGGGIVNELKRLGLAGRTVALARDAAKAAKLDGVEVRLASYDDYDALEAAMTDVEKVVLVSSSEIGNAVTQHQNVIRAAKAQGVERIFFTGIQNKGAAPYRIPFVADQIEATEAALKASGLDHTLLLNGIYMESLVDVMVGINPVDDGINVPAGSTKGSWVSRKDLAEAVAKLLAQTSPVHKEYTLNAGTTYSAPDIARALSDASHKTVPYRQVSVDTFKHSLIQQFGFAEPLANFVPVWWIATDRGNFEHPSADLETILGRKPLTLEAFFAHWLSNGNTRP